jgi:rhamnose transport system permease protein
VIAALLRYRREFAVLAVYLLLLASLLFIRPDFFDRQFFDTWLSAGPVLVMSVGMTLVIVARQIDISVGAQLSTCAVLTALVHRAGVPMPLVILLSVACGAAFGAFNGFLVAWLQLPAIVVTLATAVILADTMTWARAGEAVGGLNNFQWFGLSQTAGEIALISTTAVVFAIGVWAMRFLAAGRTVYAVGSDAEAARLAGVRPVRVTFWVFVLAGALTGLAATLHAVRQSSVATTLGQDWELKVIAAVVVGGTAITGGRGTLFGTLIGVALLTTIRPALSFWGLSPNWEKAAQGTIILLAVGSEVLLRARRGERMMALPTLG